MDKSKEIWESVPRQTVQVTLPDKRTYEGPLGTTVEAFIKAMDGQRQVPYIAALVDGRLRELSYPVRRDCQLELIDLSQSDGVRIYRRSLTFLMLVAVRQLFPGVDIFVDHSLPFGGYFCEVRDRDPFTDEELKAISDAMWQMIEADSPISRENVSLDDALQIFRERGQLDKVTIFEGRERSNKSYLRIYSLAGYRDYMHGYMVPSAGYLHYFRLLRWEDGFIMQFPRRHFPTQLLTPQRDPKLLKVFREYGRWLRLLGVESVADLNRAIGRDKLREIILVSEALHEQRIAEIAHQIWQRKGEVRVVLIAGPSSSGKTTFSKRLAVQLLAHGLRPYALELDNYFVDRARTPKDENGDYDFESLEAVDVALFNEHLQGLLRGDVVQLPKYNFLTGQRETGNVAHLEPDRIVIVEGIHGMNPQLVYALPESSTFRIYVSALTQLNLDRHNRVPTTDTRLIRRIVRDARRRGYSAMDTLARWESVRRGEKQYIFPYQENADAMFNSALVYELSVLKAFAEPLLLQVNQNSRQWVEANRLLAFLEWFQPANLELVPENSLLREFVGGLSLEDFHWGD
ncbi:MAG: nucleoside kinase [Anaerolineae bacterium]|nr:nucleoside kinase [Anaerolineae bacterium]